MGFLEGLMEGISPNLLTHLFAFASNEGYVLRRLIGTLQTGYKKASYEEIQF